MSIGYKDIADRLRIVLDELHPKATLHARAVEHGVHVNSLAKYIQGERLPSADLLCSLTRWGVDATWLLSGQGTPFIAQDDARDQRLRYMLSKVSDRALASECERRLHDAISRGLHTLQNVKQRNLTPLAKKFRRGPLVPPKLTSDELLTVFLVRQAYRSLDRIMWWFGDLDSTMRATYHSFLQLHDEVTSSRDFRIILYDQGADSHLNTLLREHDRLGELTELVEGKNLGYGQAGKHRDLPGPSDANS